MKYPPPITPSILSTIEQIEAVEDWVKRRKHWIEAEFKEKEDRKREEKKEKIKWDKVIRWTVILMTFGPWFVILQYVGLKLMLMKLLG